MSKYGYEEQAFPAEFYDPVYSSIADLDFFKDYARTTGGKILEIACGTGRVLIPLAQAGYEVTGLDYSIFMLDVCRHKLAEKAPDIHKKVRLVQGNMVNLHLDDRYSLVIIPANSFQILTSQNEQESCLRSIARHLVPSGKLIIVVFHPDFPRLFDPQYQEERETRTVNLPDGRIVRVTDRIAAYHKSEQYNEVETVYYVRHPDGTEERLIQTFPMHYFFRYEMEYLLRLCGFEVVSLYGNFDKSPFIDSSPRMIFVAEKK